MFSLLTLNIFHGIPLDRSRLDRLACIIAYIKDRRDEFPIVMLQEVFRGFSLGNALLALRKDLGGFYHLAYARAGGVPYLYEVGQATLCRFPVVRQRTYHVPSGRCRCILFTEIAAPGLRLHAYNAHLGGTAQELGEVFTVANRLARPQTMDLIMGDFNWDYLSETRNLRVADMYGFQVARAGMTATLADSVAPHADHHEAIDFILYRNVPADLTVRARRVLTGPVQGRRLSDHAGVVCTVFRRAVATDLTADNRREHGADRPSMTAPQ